ncbi:MAG: hypothetical protein B7Z27_03770 [Sphingobacteriia bacterium 32-37-4]|nr:MAG: hypothetical protein B7Z27_03770 [Sphingobacteriia bacterium 32-37-4]
MSSILNTAFKAVLLSICILLTSKSLIAQNQLSVPFTYGAIGTVGTNPQQANNITNFQTLQISKAYFIQNSATNQYTTSIQGNDIPGTLRLVTLANKYVDIAGAVVWRDGNPTSLMGFIPATSLTSFNLSSYGGSNYTVSNSSNFVVRFNNFNTVLTNGTNLSGNAATTSVLADLNNYLATSISSRPVGPVTSSAQTTASTTPTITGTVTFSLPNVVSSTDTTLSANGQILASGLPTKVEIPKVDYFIPDGFSPNRDGINDYFVVIRPFQTIISIEVFNRWGNVVYKNSNYNNDWDGRALPQNGSGDVPVGTYFYIITAKENNGQVRNFKGSITLKR